MSRATTIILGAIVGALTLGPVPMTGAEAQPVDASEPVRLVSTLTERVLSAMRESDRTNRSNTLYRVLREIILPHTDFDGVCQRVLGRHWRMMDHDERRKFREAFEPVLIRAYAAAIGEHDDPDIVYTSLRKKRSPKRELVRARISQPVSRAVIVDYRLRKTEDGWKLYDAAIEGVSFILIYRRSFATYLASSSLDSLASRLAAVNRERDAIPLAAIGRSLFELPAVNPGPWR